MRALRLVAAAAAAVLIVVVAEAFVVGVACRDQFVGVWEFRQGVRLLPLFTWALAAPVAAVGALVLLLVERGDLRPARVLLSLLSATAGAAVSLGVTSGRHFAQVTVRASFCVLVALMAGAAAYAAAPRLASTGRRSPAALGLVCLGVVVASSVANALVLPRLYPAFHLALSIVTAASAAGLSLLWRGDEAPGARPGRGASRAFVALVAAAYVASVASLPTLSRWLVRSDNVRFVFGEHAPLARYGVLLLARMGPGGEGPGPEPSGDSPGAPSSSGEGIDLRGRDIVLISVDALRADHVGAYGYGRGVSPNIDALARAGARFERAYAPTPHTSYSVSSMMTGKYIRPLLLQGAGGDSDTLPRLLRTYGYRTAAFYPPAVFFIDAERFAQLRERGLDFEYRRVEFADAEARAAQVAAYLSRVRPGRRVFLWVHLFEPHEPYEKHAEHDFGDRDIDRYDSEVAAADAGIGAILAAVRASRPGAAIVLTADHGEEFGEHGGRYHGTTVFEEQVRVPLVVVAEGLVPPSVLAGPVQTIDILPTLLGALAIPRPARVRGRDLGGFLRAGTMGKDGGFAFAETDEQTLLAEGSMRLLCARRLGACQLYDLTKDPGELRDVSAMELERSVAMRRALRDVEAAHGRYEFAGLRAEGRAWPEAIRRGISGDADAAVEVSALLDDADVVYRRKAAEVLFELSRKETAPSLRLSLTRDEDDIVRRWASLSLTRLGEGAGRTLELVEDRDLAWRRLSAFALAESGDGRGEDTLVAWWQSREMSFERAKQVVGALGRIRSKKALVPLIRALGDVRLRPYIAGALAQIGESGARPSLLEAFADERYVPARSALGEALVSLGAGAEMAPALVRFLGVPDPLEGGLSFAERGGFLASVGGPDKKTLARLSGAGGDVVKATVIVPRGRGDTARLLIRGRSRGTAAAMVRVGLPLSLEGKAGQDSLTPIEMDPKAMVEIRLEPGAVAAQVGIDLPKALQARPGRSLSLAIWRDEQAEVKSFAVVPLSEELPPPVPEPWTPSAGDQSGEVVDDGS